MEIIWLAPRGAASNDKVKHLLRHIKTFHPKLYFFYVIMTPKLLPLGKSQRYSKKNITFAKFFYIPAIKRMTTIDINEKNTIHFTAVVGRILPPCPK